MSTAPDTSAPGHKDWQNFAFRHLGSEEQLEDHIKLLSNMAPEPLNFRAPPSRGESWLKQSDRDAIVSLKGNVRKFDDLVKEEGFEMEISPAANMTGSEVRVSVVKSGVGKENFERIKSALENHDGQLAAITGTVQVNGNPYICINNAQRHMLLICTKDWQNFAFRLLGCEEQLEDHIKSLNNMASKLLNFRAPPSSGESWLKRDAIVSLKGNARKIRDLQGGGFEMEISPAANMTGSEVRVSVVKSGVGKENLKGIKSALESHNKDDGQLAAITGTVQVNFHNGNPYICINNAQRHVLLICAQTQHPLLHDMFGAPIDLSTPVETSRLLGPFRNAWFCSSSQWSALLKSKKEETQVIGKEETQVIGKEETQVIGKEEIQVIRQHVAAYRNSGGGVIYIGLKGIKQQDGFRVLNDSIELSSYDVENLKDCITNSCKIQCPPCVASEELTSTSVPGNVKQMRDVCLYSCFNTTSARKRYVFRLIVCSSENSLNLVKPSHIKLRRRPGQECEYYKINEFFDMMSNLMMEVNKALSNMLRPPPSNFCIPEVTIGSPLRLWDRDSLPEGAYVEHKGPTTDKIAIFVVKQLVKYAPVWLNNPNSMAEGSLYIGVSDKPHEVIGIWLKDTVKMKIIKHIAERFRGSIKESNFCFPPAIDHFLFIKYPVEAYPGDLLSKENEVLVFWLKRLHNSSNSEPCDSARHSFADYLTTGILKGINEKLLVLPLDCSLFQPVEGAFPVAISKPKCSRNGSLIDTLPEEIDKTGSEFVTRYEYKNFKNKTSSVIDPNYCVLKIVVKSSKVSKDSSITPPSTAKLLHLCELPEFYHLAGVPASDDYIGKSPAKMDFQDIVLRCNDSNRAWLSLFHYFQPTDRPILITNVGNGEASVIEGLARIPWSLVIDFEFDATNANALRNLAEAKSQVYRIADLTLKENDPANLEAMSDTSPIYWIKALGSSGDQDFFKWIKLLVPQLESYIKQALARQRVGIIVVWCKSHETDARFIRHTATYICLPAQSPQTKLAVVSPAAEVLDAFNNSTYPQPADEIAMKLEDLSKFLMGVEIDIVTAGGVPIESRPRGDSKIPEETIKSMQANEMDYLYPGIENDLDTSCDYDFGKAFFEGREQFARWTDFVAKNVVNRPETDQIYKDVKRLLTTRQHINEFHFGHYPGTGGSTVSRHVLWKLKDDGFYCVIPSQIYTNLREDVNTLIEISNGKCALVLWDTNIGIDFDVLKLKLRGLDVIFLCVERCFIKPHNVSIYLKENLTYTTLKAFWDHLKNNKCFTDDSSKYVDDLLLSAKYGGNASLFLLMVTALESKYTRLRSYVRDRLSDLTEDQKAILCQVAFFELYTGKPLYKRAVNSTDPDWEKNLRLKIRLYDLMTFSTSRFVHMRHNCINEIVISEIQGFSKSDEDWGKWMAKYVVELIGHLRVVYNDYNYTNPNNEFERVYRSLFHDKDESFRLPYFLALMESLAGNKVVIGCMKSIQELLPPQCPRILAHFHGDMARVHLYINAETVDLKSAVNEMKKAHGLLKDDRTLHHQEGCLYYGAIELTKDRYVDKKKPNELAIELLNLSKRASSCFRVSRDCEMHNRPDSDYLYPWTTDVQCRIKCMQLICKLLNCTFRTLPRPLDKQDYILNFEEETISLLEGLSSEGIGWYKSLTSDFNKLLGSKKDYEEQLQRYLKVITDSGEHKNPYELAQAVHKVDRILCIHLYNGARQVPVDISTTLTTAICRLIRQNRIINNDTGQVLVPPGHQDRFFELELLWRWSRYSQPQVSLDFLLSCIDKYEEGLARTGDLPEKAKCQLYKGVTLLLKRVLGEDLKIAWSHVTTAIKSCCETNCNGNYSWRYKEYLMDGYGSGLLSSYDWKCAGHDCIKINNPKSLNHGVDDKTHHVKPRMFSGVVTSEQEVDYEGLRLNWKKRGKATKSWTINSPVQFYIAVCARKGLIALPVMQLTAEELGQSSGGWNISGKNSGVISNISEDEDLVYFKLPEGRCDEARCQLRDLPKDAPKPNLGDRYTFSVQRRKIGQEKTTYYEVQDLRFEGK